MIRPVMAFGLDGLTHWALKEILPLLLLFIGISIIVSFRSGQLTNVLRMVGITVLGVIVIFSAGPLSSLADKITNLLSGGN